MDNIAGSKSSLSWVVNISVVALVMLWLFPTVGLLVSSFRTADQIAGSGWWASLSSQERQNPAIRIAGEEIEMDGLFVIEGRLFEVEADVSAWGTSSRAPEAFGPGDIADISRDRTVTVQADGAFRFTAPESQEGKRLPRVFTTAETAPEFTLENYERVLIGGSGESNMAKAFFNTLTVTIPATIIPILIAAFAAYALAWMDFPGRALLIAIIVGLLVVPLQLALIPLLQLHNQIGIGKGYLGVWMAHTGFGLPLAIYLLRNYMVGLPRDIIENARVDGA
ncbi:MAG: carbohydrate ABC transporter permease, partial [Pseudomonadota bacterium]